MSTKSRMITIDHMISTFGSVDFLRLAEGWTGSLASFHRSKVLSKVCFMSMFILLGGLLSGYRVTSII